MNQQVLKQAAERYQDYIISPYDVIMNLSGFEAICEFSRNFGGSSVYIPGLRTIFSDCIDQDIIDRYNGRNIRELIQNYGYSENRIRRLIKSCAR